MNLWVYDLINYCIAAFDIFGAVCGLFLLLFIFMNPTYVTKENCVVLVGKFIDSSKFFLMLAITGLGSQAARQYITVTTGFSPRDDELIGWVFKDIALNYLMASIAMFLILDKLKQYKKMGGDDAEKR